MIILYPIFVSASLLKNLASLSEIIIAIANIILAYYVFVYQKKKDVRDNLERSKSIERTINLQWFKELIIHPNLNDINTYFEIIEKKLTELLKPGITSSDKININEDLKNHTHLINKKFISLLYSIDSKYAEKMEAIFDKYVDGITNSIFDKSIELTISTIFEEKITDQLIDFRRSVIRLIYNFKGTSIN